MSSRLETITSSRRHKAWWQRSRGRATTHPSRFVWFLDWNWDKNVWQIHFWFSCTVSVCAEGWRTWCPCTILVGRFISCALNASEFDWSHIIRTWLSEETGLTVATSPSLSRSKNLPNLWSARCSHTSFHFPPALFSRAHPQEQEELFAGAQPVMLGDLKANECAKEVLAC